MIVEALGNRVVVRYRDENGYRKEQSFNEKPYCFVADEDALWVEALSKQTGFKGVFGENLTKITTNSTWDIRDIAKTGRTWEGNIPLTNQVLTARAKRGDKPFEAYKHRVWYLDGEWKTDNGEITMLTVYDSFSENLYSWVVMPHGIAKGKYSQLIDESGQTHHYETPVIVFDTEKELLQHFMNFMVRQDPDIITGWYVCGADLKQIFARCQRNNLNPSVMSPHRKVKYEFGDWKQPILGRNVIDLRIAFPKLYELKNGKLPNYKLDDVADIVLGERKLPLPDGHDTYYSDPVLYLEYNRKDVELLPRLNATVNALEYYIAIQHIAQCEIASTPHITQVFTCLALSDPEFEEQIPTKAQFEKVDYDGAIVMNGETDVYDNIGIFDVKAMYHSNASLHNISWDTLDVNGVDCGNGTKFNKDRKGLLVRQMDNMTVLREHYKKLMREATTDEERVRYDALQYATKSLVASMYGVAGDSKYSLYHPEIASAITYSSRKTLMKLKQVTEEAGFPVIYGHTDSVMCEVDTVELGLEKLESINEKMHPIIVQFEKWSSKFLLMNKNRYAGLVSWTDGEYHEPKMYVKGIEMKQARMPPVMKNAMGIVIGGILEGKTENEITEKIVSLVGDIVNRRIDDVDICMKGKLKNDISKYKVLSGMSAGASWSNINLGKGYRQGDDFLCCIDTEGNYIAFDDPSEIEGIAKIGYEIMVERFIIKKLEPYYETLKWNISPIIKAKEGRRQTFLF
jgi:DNA polymerase elongation subunit (family B)